MGSAIDHKREKPSQETVVGGWERSAIQFEWIYVKGVSAFMKKCTLVVKFGFAVLWTVIRWVERAHHLPFTQFKLQ